MNEKISINKMIDKQMMESEINKKPIERYEIRLGKWGIYFHDKIDDKNLTLGEILLILNMSKIKLVRVAEEPKEVEVKVKSTGEVVKNE